MRHRRRRFAPPLRLPLGLARTAGLTTLAAVLAAAASAGAGAVPRAWSSNWSGYAVSGPGFSSVSASWTQPAANCLGRWTSSTAASFWVGLGGNSVSSKTGKVEQIGTDSDCASDGSDSYYAWYELWPAGAVNLDLAVGPGDRIAASVSVRGDTVVVRLRDLSTHAGVTRSLRMDAPDTSSAEWIAEAPSFSDEGDSAAMTNFGTIRFSDARATTVTGHRGAISDRRFDAGAIDFASDPDGRHVSPIRSFLDRAAAARAIPSPLAPGGSAFSVTWEGAGALAKTVAAGSV